MATLLAAAVPFVHLLAADSARAVPAQRWLARREGLAEDYLYLPLRARDGDGVIVIDADLGYPVDVLAIDPWFTVAEAPL
jgi:hypothetical protein